MLPAHDAKLYQIISTTMIVIHSNYKHFPNNTNICTFLNHFLLYSSTLLGKIWEYLKNTGGLPLLSNMTV